MENNIEKTFSEIVLSVGTHRKKRFLSPVEIAERIQIVKDGGYSNADIAKIIKLDTTMLKKFLNLLVLEPSIKHLIDWGISNESTISFSSANQLKVLDDSEQILLAKAIIEYKIKKNEVQQIVEIRDRSSKRITVCIEEVMKMRPTIIKKNIYIGSITDSKTIEYLKSVSQCERDGLLKSVLNSILYEGTKWSGRLGINRFSLIGDSIFSNQINRLSPDFETVIVKLLKDFIENG